MKKIYNYILALVAWIAIAGCQKVEVGFLSDTIFYLANPFRVEQGVVTYSGSLEVDGSTKPLKVTVLDLRNKATGESVLSDFTTEREVVTFNGEITAEDITLEALEAKLEKRMVKPFNVNGIGGRIEFSSASKFLPMGTYEMDILIENSRGSRVINNVCDIVVQEPASFYNIIYKAWTFSDYGAETNFVSPGDELTIDVNWDPTGDNVIIFRWEDQNGVAFNPKNNEIIKRGDRPTFADWSPYYAEEKTDTEIRFKFPSTSLPYPLINTRVIAGTQWTDPICYYRVSGQFTDIGKNINTVGTIKFTRDGTYTVTYKMAGVRRK